MAASKLVIFSLFFALILTAADVSIQGEDVPPLTASDAVDSSPLKIELDQLKSKIRSLGLHFVFSFYLYFYLTPNHAWKGRNINIETFLGFSQILGVSTIDFLLRSQSQSQIAWLRILLKFKLSII